MSTARQDLIHIQCNRLGLTLITFSILIIALVSTASRTFSSCAAPTFLNGPTFTSAGVSPSSIAIGDLNADGKPDLAVVNEDSSSVSIFLGNGDGTFRVLQGFLVGLGPRSIAVGDVDGDGKLDLVVANRLSNSVSILGGNGDGTFRIRVDFIIGGHPSFVALGDFNGDGKIDLALITQDDGNATILLGNGDGTFQGPVGFSTGVNPQGLAVGDFNRDGKADLAVANENSDTVSILLGNGDGTFKTAVNLSAGARADFVTVADLDGDGRADLVVANRLSNSVSVLLGKGDGTFQTPVEYLTQGISPNFIAVADYNGDGKLDLAVLNENSISVAILLGNGDGTFQLAVLFLAGPSPQAILTSEFTGDGKADLVVVNKSTNTVSLLLNGCTSPTNAVNLQVLPGGSNTTSTLGSEGPVQAGDAIVNLTTGAAPFGTAVFSVTQNGVVVAEAGVPASPPTTAARIFIDLQTGATAKSGRLEATAITINTGFAIVNRGGATANVIFTLREINGQPTAIGHGLIPAGAHIAKFINQLLDIAPDFVLPSTMLTGHQFATLEIRSDQPLSVLALRLTTNQRGETLITSTPIADLTKPPSTDPVFFPQFVDGGGYQSEFFLLNTSTVVANGTIKILGNDGVPLNTSLVNGQAGSSFPYSIPPAGFFIFQTTGLVQTVNTGSVQIVRSGNFTPVAAGVFKFTRGNILVTESGIAATIPTTHARIFVDTSTTALGHHNTGLAIANPELFTALNLAVTAFQADGLTPVAVPTNFTTLPGGGHTAAFAGELVPGLPGGFIGVFDMTSASPFVALTLRSLDNSRGDQLLTTFPVADFNQPAPFPIVFPQIADGGGFKTQIILLGAGIGANTTINFFTDNGSALAVAKKP
ncbi:MAG: VCBS repeat-containing protein [Acidobacteriia bacterium]|nr:VCBS repeat-containing protein [Terriglobia bacterium]